MFEHNALGYWSGLALCLTKVRSSRARCPATALILRPFQDYFSSYEMGQSVGGAKMGELREKPPGTSVSRTWIVSQSQVARVGLEPTPDTAVR